MVHWVKILVFTIIFELFNINMAINIKMYIDDILRDSFKWNIEYGMYIVYWLHSKNVQIQMVYMLDFIMRAHIKNFVSFENICPENSWKLILIL